MKLSEEFPSKYYAKEDLEGGPVTLTIAGNELHVWPDGERSVILSFLETDKTLTLNKTKRGQVLKAFGDETDRWIGRQVEISHDPNVRYGPKVVGGIALQALASTQAVAAPAGGPIPVDDIGF